MVTWTVVFHPEAQEEYRQLPQRERQAIANAVDKLIAFGPSLPYPHSSAVQGADRIRELRPRQGRSPWRVFYRHLAEALVIGAVGPEAQVNPRKFNRSVTAAQQRLDEMEKNP